MTPEGTRRLTATFLLDRQPYLRGALVGGRGVAGLRTSIARPRLAPPPHTHTSVAPCLPPCSPRPRSEVQLHGKLAHGNVIGLYGAFQVDSQVVMVQEFADGGDLFTLLHRCVLGSGRCGECGRREGGGREGECSMPEDWDPESACVGGWGGEGKVEGRGEEAGGGVGGVRRRDGIG